MESGDGTDDEDWARSAKEFEQVLDDFFAAHPEELPALPADFSRADIYDDHD